MGRPFPRQTRKPAVQGLLHADPTGHHRTARALRRRFVRRLVDRPAPRRRRLRCRARLQPVAQQGHLPDSLPLSGDARCGQPLHRRPHHQRQPRGQRLHARHVHRRTRRAGDRHGGRNRPARPPQTGRPYRPGAYRPAAVRTAPHRTLPAGRTVRPRHAAPNARISASSKFALERLRPDGTRFRLDCSAAELIPFRPSVSPCKRTRRPG